MAFIVEDGTEVLNANSYVSVSYADTYFTLFNNLEWSGEDENKQVALIHGTKSIDLLFGQRYISLPKNSTQSLLWPRHLCVINGLQLIQPGTIPKLLKDAVCEVALLSIQGEDVYPVPNTDRQVEQESVTVGDLSVSKTYRQNTKGEGFALFNKIELLLTPLLRPEAYCPERFVF